MRYLMVVLAVWGVGAIDANAAVFEKWGDTWSEVTGTRYHEAILNRRPAIIKSVDGRDYVDRIVKIEPGKHEITVQSLKRKGFQGSDAQMQIDVQPCKRYYLNAQFASGVGVEWKPVVDYVDTIAGCKVDTAKQ
jgi:hypothetical protein